MADPYRIADRPDPGPPVRPASPAAVGRGVLWLILVLSVAGNSVSSFAGVSTAVHLALGIVTVLCIGALVVLRPRQ